MRNYTTRTSVLPAACALVPSAFLAEAPVAWVLVERTKGAAPTGSIQIPQMSALVGTSLSNVTAVSARKGLVQASATVQAVGDVRGVPPRGRPV
jgi:hypothetical protein